MNKPRPYKPTDSLNSIVSKVVDAILPLPYFTREALHQTIRTNLVIWVKLIDRPQNYENIKSEKGQLVRTIEQKDLELTITRQHLRAIATPDQLQKCFDEIDELLVIGGYKAKS